MKPALSLSLLALALALALAGMLPGALFAGEVEKSAPFRLDDWYELKATDGPVTLHRIRIVRTGSAVKSRLMRPGNSEYLEDIRIELEYTNEASRDWETKIKIEWLDENGKTIDGYNDSENLDNDSRFDTQTVVLSTLRYGLDLAKKLRIEIEFYPD